MSFTRHRRRTGDSFDDLDEEQFLQPRKQESFGSIRNGLASRQSSLRSQNSSGSMRQQAAHGSLESLKTQESRQSLMSLRSHDSQQSVVYVQSHASMESQKSNLGIPAEFNYLFRPNQIDDNVLALDPNSPITLSIGVVCVTERTSTHKQQPDVKAHALPKTFYAFPKNSGEEIKKEIQEQIDDDIADFKMQGYNVNTYTFGLPFIVDATCNITRGYDGKAKMLKAERKRVATTTSKKSSEHQEEASTSSTSSDSKKSKRTKN